MGQRVRTKRKKYKWDSLLPRSGLNPGFLPDKGQAGVDSFNNMNTPSFSGNIGCCEDLQEWLTLNDFYTAFENDEDLRDKVLSGDIKELKGLQQLLLDKKIDKTTPLTDNKYYIKSTLDSLSNYAGYNSADNLLTLFLNYLESGDYSSAFELADIPYPEYNNFTKEVDKALSSEKGQELLTKFGINVSDARKAVTGFGELHDIIQISAITSLFNSMVSNIKQYLSSKAQSENKYYTDINKNIIKIHILDLFDQFHDLNKENLPEYVKRYTKSKLNGNIGSTHLDDYLSSEVNSYSLDQKDFLETLEDNLEYYYN